MATRRRSEGAATSSAAPHTGGEKGRRVEQSGYRDWSGLPDQVLFLVAMSLIGSLADMLAFGGVCRAWRSFARSNERDLMSSLPPLLRRDWDAEFYCPADGRWYTNRPLTAWLWGDGRLRTLGWRFRTLGCSFGHLIFRHLDVNTDGQIFSVVNPLTGTRACKFPPSSHSNVIWAALSSPPGSPDCVLWSFDGCFLGFCRQGDQKWSAFSTHGRYYEAPSVFLGDKGYVEHEGKLMAFDRYPLCSSSEWTILPMGGSSSLAQSSYLRLCVSDAELLLVRAVLSVHSHRIKGFRVYRFDFSGAEWVRLRSLGDRTLFWDRFCATVSDNPGRWGGCGDCIYFVDTDGDTLCVFHLKDRKMLCLAGGSPSNSPPFPQYPVWVHPSLCY